MSPVLDYLLHPADELRGRLIDVMRHDTVLLQLLFPADAPSKGPLDTRVYDLSAELPLDLRQIMPRINVNTVPGAPPYEQITMTGPVTVYVHSLAPRQNKALALALDTRIRQLMSGTVWSTARIIIAEPVPVSRREEFREPYIDDAWRITSQFLSPNVGIQGE